MSSSHIHAESNREVVFVVLDTNQPTYIVNSDVHSLIPRVNLGKEMEEKNIFPSDLQRATQRIVTAGDWLNESYDVENGTKMSPHDLHVPHVPDLW